MPTAGTGGDSYRRCSLLRPPAIVHCGQPMSTGNRGVQANGARSLSSLAGRT